MEKPFVSIVIPTLNEEKNLKTLLPDLINELKDYKYEIIVVDGHSKDKTVEIAKKFGCKVFYENKGKGYALRLGFKKARGDIIISMDADLSHRPKEARLLIEGIKIGYDIAMGSRFIIGGGSSDMPFYRKWGNKFFVFLVNLLFKGEYTDLCYGYRAFNRKALKKLNLKEDGFGIETEISIKALKNKLKIIEIPSFEKKREYGNGKLRTFRDGYVILKTIILNLFSR